MARHGNNIKGCLHRSSQVGGVSDATPFLCVVVQFCAAVRLDTVLSRQLINYTKGVRGGRIKQTLRA